MKMGKCQEKKKEEMHFLHKQISYLFLTVTNSEQSTETKNLKAGSRGSLILKRDSDTCQFSFFFFFFTASKLKKYHGQPWVGKLKLQLKKKNYKVIL